jgi:response regulator NasT
VSKGAVADLLVRGRTWPTRYAEPVTSDPTQPEGSPTPQESPVPVPAAPPPPGGLRVLLAEDEALIRMDLAEMLVEAGHQVVGQAADGDQAVELARELSPDVVVMDIKMPGMDGISAAELLGREGVAPVVLLTAFSDRNLVERARDAGVMGYVVKPFTAVDILPVIDIARPRWQEFRALQSEVADLAERFETRKRLDRAKGLLMQQSKLSEAEAFRWIQKSAMDRRTSMREVADTVIGKLDSERPD